MRKGNERRENKEGGKRTGNKRKGNKEGEKDSRAEETMRQERK